MSDPQQSTSATPGLESGDQAFAQGHDGGQRAYGKYLLINVPGYNGVEDGPPRGSYLRLGAVQDRYLAGSPDAPPATGEDLAAKVQPFIDDTRVRDGCPAFIPAAERQKETARLHTKGGIRLHTDGNLVETVRGDCVCVVGGHYRMEMLCRQESGEDWASTDISGGHFGRGGITFRGGGSIEYTPRLYGGTWSVFEDTEKGHVSTTYHGKVFERMAGDFVHSVTGLETPSAELPNPVVTEKTWAESISSYTGSAAWPVPLIEDETWAKVMTSDTHADTSTSTTTVSGAITEVTEAGSVSSATSVSGAISDDTTAGSMTSTTTAGAITDTTTAGVITSTTTGNVVDTTVGVSLSTIIGAETEIILGNSMEVNLGAQESFTLGAVLDVTIGLIIDVALAGSLSVDVGPRLEFAISRTWGYHLDLGKTRANRAKASAVQTDASTTSVRAASLNEFP
ncbi:MAG: hypothetical protein QM820_41965 [Minicystis sp.]